MGVFLPRDRKSTRLNSSHTVIYTLSLHDALPIYGLLGMMHRRFARSCPGKQNFQCVYQQKRNGSFLAERSEEHTSELQSHSDLHSFPTRRSSDLWVTWDDAQAFCKKLSGQTKFSVRLPTEAEWEFSCR